MKNQGAAVQFANEIFFWNLHVSKNQPSGTAAARPQKPILILTHHAGASFHQDCTDALVLVGVFIKVGPAIYEKNIRRRCPYNKALLSVEHKMIAVKHCAGGGPEKIRSAPRFGECFGADHFALQNGS